MKSLQELIAEYNAKADKPIKSWKLKRVILEERIAKLNGEPAPVADTPTEVAAPAATEPAEPAVTKEKPVAAAKKAAKKKPAKKAAKKKPAAKANGASKSGIGAFVVEMVGKDKGTKEIFDAAQAKGFETTYKSVASMVCRAKK